MEPEPIDDNKEPKEPPASETKIDWSKVDPKEVPHEIVQHTMAFSGLLNDVQDLRAKNQTLAESIELLQSELQKKDSDENKDPDEFVTRKDLKAVLEEQKALLQKGLEKEKEYSKVKDDNESVRRLRSEYSIETTPKGLDADTVLREGGMWLAENKPHLFEAARKGPDPAAEIYRLSLVYAPSIKKRAKLAENSQFLDNIKTGQIPKGSAAYSEGLPADELNKLLNSNEDEILAAIEKEELG
jgi:hypothetical protein